MKSVFFLFLSIFILMPSVDARNIIPNGAPPSEKIPAELIRCDSVSNVWLKYEDEIKRVHLIAFDSEDGSLNNEINKYFCETLSNANKIEVEYDVESTDKYNRELVFIHVNDELFQSNLISKGYGQVNFVNKNYKHLNELCTIQKDAIIAGLGIWQYPNIKEKYCNSGVEIGSKDSIKETVKTKSEKKETKHLKTMVFINAGILILLLLYRRHS